MPENVFQQFSRIFGRRRMPEIVKTRRPNFKAGLITSTGPRDIVRGAASDSLNWQNKGDRIELRRGQAFLGTTSVNSGSGKASGICKVVDSLGVEHLFGTYGKSLKYFDIPTQEWIENGTNLLGAKVVDANGLASEDIFLSGYTTNSGNQLWVNSPNCAGYFKIMIANPGSSVDQTASGNFKGYVKIDNNRTLLWGRTTDQTGLYGSYIDTQTYTTVTGEAYGTGDGVTKTFAHTAAARSGARTIFAVTVTAGAITLTDNYNGVLAASDGSTGTVNYATGAISVTFAVAPANLLAITTTYQWEDSTNNGIADYTKSGTRTAGQGFIFRQDDGGGALQGVFGYNGVYYCMHLLRSWALTIGQTDTSATNLPYRHLVGIPNPRAAVEAGEGIYYIDSRDPTNIKVRLLTYGVGNNAQVLPVPVSNNIILNNYLFDLAASCLWGDLVLFSCRTTDSTVNNRVLVYNKLWKAWEILDYNVSCFEVYNGTLIGGDSVTNNFITLFSGWDDLGSLIDNYWIGNMDNADMDGAMKSTKYIYLEGDIADGQSFDVYLAPDNGSFVKVGTIMSSGDYVDKSQSIAIGGTTLGKKAIGGDISPPSAYHYELLLPVNTEAYEYTQIKFQATAVGYLNVRTYRFWDNRYKGVNVPFKHRQPVKYTKNY